MSEDRSSSRELYFLYELAKAFASSIELAEVTENVLDGTCALLGTEQGFLLLVDDEGALRPHASRGLSSDALEVLSGQLGPAMSERRALLLAHPSSPEGAMLATPLLVRDRVLGLVGVSTAYSRRFSSQEEDRLAAVANLGSLAMENARMHEKVQKELALMRRLIGAAQKMEAGLLTAEEAAELARVEGWDEISHLGQAFGRMAQQVMIREDQLKRQVEELRIQIDQAKKIRQVAEITETDYFQELRKKVKELRERGY